MSSPSRSRRRRQGQGQELRRQLVIGDRAAVKAFVAGWTCPDCHSDFAGFWVDELGRMHGRVEHDPGCPWAEGVTG
jgi:hypothetical protein